MMSAEYPEVIPEPFNYPCASYSGNAEDFINDMVDTCRSPFTSLGYSDSSCPPIFPSDSSRHLLIQELAARQELLHESKQGRSSYSCEPNVVIIVKDSGEIVANRIASCSTEPTKDMERFEAGNLSVQSSQSPNIKELAHNLLSAQQHTPPPRLNLEDSSTPTPIYTEKLTTPDCGIRGSEVAELDGTPTDCEEVRKEEGPYKLKLRETGMNEEDSGTVCQENSSSSGSSLQCNRRRTGSTLLQYIPPTHRNLPLPSLETRKLSDSALCMGRDRFRKIMNDQTKQRCLSDTHAPNSPFLLDEDERESSALGCDSGFQDDKGSRFHENTSTHCSSPRVSVQSLDLLSQDEGSDIFPRGRRVTPYMPYSLLSQDGSQSDDLSSVYQSSCSGNPGTMVHPRERTRRSLMKHFSQGSISGLSLSGASVGGASVGGASSIGASSDSPSLSSILDCQSNATGVTDLLSSLGFDDFDSPQLVPDRFIPKELEHLKPSFMKTAFIEQNLYSDPPRSPDSLASGQYSNSIPQKDCQMTTRATEPPSDLPLGATAENFLDYKPRPSSPVPTTSATEVPPKEEEPSNVSKKPTTTPLFTDTMHFSSVDLTRSRILETVPEETASDLSPSPRWFSPRVSIDHSVHLDLAEGKLGASLNVQKVRKRSLPTNREGYRWSIGSQVESDTGDSIHLSVTSYDDMIAAEREKEREHLPEVICDDTLVGGVTRRRRKGVYNPPQTLLSWLSTQKTIDEEEDADPDELPWPFNEQARLRKSLTEISLAQKNALSESVDNEDHCGRHTSNSISSSQRDIMSVSPISTPDRCSPQPTLSEEEDRHSGVLDQRHNRKDGHLRVSSPFACPNDHLSALSINSSLDHQESLVDPETDEAYPSTISLLHTERGSLATLASEASLTESLQHPFSVSPSDEDRLSHYSNPHAQQPDSLSQSPPRQSNSSNTLLLPQSVTKNEPLFQVFEDSTSIPAHKTEITELCEKTAPEPKEVSKVARQDNARVSQLDSALTDLPASHITIMSSAHTSWANRRRRFAEKKPQSFEDVQSQEVSGATNASFCRVRRKPVYGDAPPSPCTDQFLLTPIRGETCKEQKEVEKFMIL